MIGESAGLDLLPGGSKQSGLVTGEGREPEVTESDKQEPDAANRGGKRYRRCATERQVIAV